MKLRFKMWNNDNDGFRVADCFVHGLNELKEKVKELRKDWQNIEAYKGSEKVVSVYNA